MQAGLGTSILIMSSQRTSSTPFIIAMRARSRKSSASNNFLIRSSSAACFINISMWDGDMYGFAFISSLLTVMMLSGLS